MRSDDNLPPGCTARDIDEAMGGGRRDMPLKECPECEGHGVVWPEEFGGGVPRPCNTCDGEGEIEMTAEEASEHAADARAEKADRQRDADIDRQMGL